MTRIKDILETVFVYIDKWRVQCLSIPFLSRIASLGPEKFAYITIGAGIVCLVLIVLALVLWFKHHKTKKLRKKLKTFFGITDLQGYKIAKMKGVGDKYFRPENGNYLTLALPYWKGSKDGEGSGTGKRKKVVRPESVLWLCAGRKVYVLRTRDPLDMLFLVHFLRESGVVIPPCFYELDKQERQGQRQGSTEEILQRVLVEMNGNEGQFVELCKSRLADKGYKIITAENAVGVDIFARNSEKTYAVKCFLTQRETLTGMEALKTFDLLIRKTYSHSCMFITTGKVTYAAAQYANENGIIIICDEDLVSFLDKTAKPESGKEFRQWELTQDDLIRLVPDGISLKK